MRAEEIIRKSVAILQERAENYLAQGQLEEAEKACEQSLKIQPDSAKSCKLLADVLQRQQQWERSRHWYLEALKYQPDWPEVHANLGSWYGQHQQWPQAIGHYQQALTLRPDFAGVYRNLAKIWQQTQQPQKALESAYRAAVLEPETLNAQVHCDLGYQLQRQNQWDKAEACYKNALAIDDRWVPAYEALIAVLKHQGKANEAAPYYRRAIALMAKPAVRQPDPLPQDTLAATLQSPHSSAIHFQAASDTLVIEPPQHQPSNGAVVTVGGVGPCKSTLSTHSINSVHCPGYQTL
ncbi:MAG: tetratricopeptide repeat protein [Oscillatoriales cyanobacterium SM2_3_0]|nr:tetratricopeptide repeat protein [Oscillatoriales cyanobacterium SM2_3_0]